MKQCQFRIFPMLLLSLGFLFGTAFALDSPDAFQVEVEPSVFQVNQAVDFVVKAIKNGDVMKNADFNFFISVVSEDGENDIIYADYVVPGEGFSSFVATDQGIKKFSKGLLVRKPGNYLLKIEDFQNENISGSTVIIVNSDTEIEMAPISIVSPNPGNIETDPSVQVIATASKIPNTRIQIFLNNKMVKETSSSNDGTISDTIDGLNTGNNIVQLKAFSIDNKEIGTSEIISFEYKPLGEVIYDSLTISPDQDLKLGDKIKFDLVADERVSSAKLIFSSGKEYPMERETGGKYIKELILLNTGDIEVSLEMVALENTKKYPNVLNFYVKDHIRIGEIKLQTTGSDLSVVDLSWNLVGSGVSNYFAIFYGTGKDELSETLLSVENFASITGLDYGKRYYLQVQALNNQYESEGIPSDIIEFDMPHFPTQGGQEGTSVDIKIEPGEKEHSIVQDEPLCLVKNIQFQTKKIGSRYYLTWSEVDNVEKYRIYRSDSVDMLDKKMVGETTLSRFEYPFDKTVEDEIYAFYSIEGICKDGKVVMVADAKKVQVGPLEDILLIVSTTLLIFFVYRFYLNNAH